MTRKGITGICPRCQRERLLCQTSMCRTCNETARRRKSPELRAAHALHSRQYRQRYPERVKQQDRKRSQTDSRKKWQQEYNRRYYQKNRERLCQYQRDWRRANPEQRDHYKKARRSRVKNLPTTLTYSEWEDILKEFDHSCAYCQSKDSDLEHEHMIPSVHGGGFTADNIIPACHRCNTQKSSLNAREFISRGYASNPHPALLRRLEITVTLLPPST